MSDTATTPPSKNPAPKIAVGVILLLLGMVVLYALMDRMAPSSSRGVVSAYVVQIAPRVSGQVTEVHVVDDAVVQAGDDLFSLDPRPFQLAVRLAEANLKAALQNVNASSASLVAENILVMDPSYLKVGVSSKPRIHALAHRR